MKIGIISDIHANLYSIMEIYSKLEREEVDSIVCIGDIVGYGPHPNEVISFIKRKHMIALKGIYDLAVINSDFTDINESTSNIFSLDFTKQELTKNNIYYLSNLPTEMNLNFGKTKVNFVHRNTYDEHEVIYEDFLICGCTHIAGEEKVGKDKFIINPGSAGIPSENGETTFGVLEISENFHKFQIMTSEYSYEKLQKDMRMLNFPEILIDSYNKK